MSKALEQAKADARAKVVEQFGIRANPAPGVAWNSKEMLEHKAHYEAMHAAMAAAEIAVEESWVEPAERETITLKK